MTAPLPPAGWYPDPERSGEQRYWDGTTWTEHRQTAAAAPARSGLPASRASMPGIVGTVRGWFGRLTPAGWLSLVGLSFVVFIAFGNGGFSGGLIFTGLIVLATAIFALATGRRSWAGIAGRKAAAGVLVAGLAVTMAGAAASSIPSRNTQTARIAEASPTRTVPSEPTATATPSPTPTSVGEPDSPKTVVAYPGGASVGIADSSITQGSALALLETLPVKGRAPKTGYARTGGFGTAWLDVDRNGCDTRNDILARDLEPEVKAGPCKVVYGTLVDPYTGSTIKFVRGNTTSLAVQIDHVVSLMNAWETGAQQLSYAQRVSLANDPLNLFAVDGEANGKKGAGDAATWLPPKKDFRCTYVARQVSVKATYGLWVTQPEHDAIAAILNGCPDEPAVTSVFTPVAQPFVAPAPAPEPAPEPEPEPEPAPEPAPEPGPAPAPPPSDVYYENCDAVRAAGAAPLYAGDPGYTHKLDRDKDGVACE